MKRRMGNKLKQLEKFKVNSTRIFKATNDINKIKYRSPLLIIFQSPLPLIEPTAVKRPLSGEEMLAVNDQLQTNKSSVKNTAKSLNGNEIAIARKDSSE